MSEPLYPGARLRDTLRDSWRIWRHRWAILGAFGLTEERFHAWPLPAQRAFIAACVGAVLLVIVGPFSGVAYYFGRNLRRDVSLRFEQRDGLQVNGDRVERRRAQADPWRCARCW